jgi:hypothetical protein
MKLSHQLIIITAAVLSAADTLAQQSFQLSSKFHEARFVRGQLWNGQHRFGNVFCLTFPRSADAEAIAEAMYNNNTLYFSRAAYNDTTGLYVVASTVPAGISSELEIENLAAVHRKSADAYPSVITASQSIGLLGPSLTLTIRNSLEGKMGSPFPFARSIASRSDGRLASLSVHRLFVYKGSRIEVAGLRYFKEPVESDQESKAVSELAAFVEEAAESLQSCTVTLQGGPK